MEANKLLLRPEFISSASLYQTLKNDGILDALAGKPRLPSVKAEVYVISPADLDFVQIDKTLKKNAINSSGTDLKDKMKKIPKHAIVIIDGVMLHQHLDTKGYNCLYLDTLGLDTSLVSLFKEVRRIQLQSLPQVLYKTLQTEQPEKDLDTNLSIWDESRHVIFGNKELEVMSLDDYKNSITDFNLKDKGVLYINKNLTRHVTNCDYLHVICPMYKWDFEFLITMLYRSTYTAKDLKVVFYVRNKDVERYNELVSHLNEHLAFEDSNLEQVTALKLDNQGRLHW